MTDYPDMKSDPMLMSDEEPNKYAGRELLAWGEENVFICHVSSVEEDESFQIFRDRILQSEVEIRMESTDSLVTCMLHNHCLSGDLGRAVTCLLTSSGIF